MTCKKRFDFEWTDGSPGFGFCGREAGHDGPCMWGEIETVNVKATEVPGRTPKENDVKKALLFICALLLALPVTAQNRTIFAGQINVADYAYGIAAGSPPLIVTNPASSTAGSATTFTISSGCTIAGDGTPFCPLATNAPITINDSNGADTATPSAVSGCGASMPPNSCLVTVNFTNSHGQGSRISTGSYGLQEALNIAVAQKGVGEVALSPGFAAIGGTVSTITSANGYSTVTILNNGAFPTSMWYTWQQSALTLLAAPAAQVQANITQLAACPTGATCSWTATQPYFQVAYVDALGQLSAGSTAFQTAALTASLPVVIASPAASTGAVGWIAFAGSAGGVVSYLLPVTTPAGLAIGTTAAGAGSGCTLTTLEVAIPACAIGSNATFNPIFVNTNMLSPLTTNTTANIANPVYQAHTTFAYAPTASNPAYFQTNFTIFPANTASEASTNLAVVGTASLPTGYLNTIGRSFRVTGRATSTMTTAGENMVLIKLGWMLGYSAGGPNSTLCTIRTVAVTAGTALSMPFSCTITVSAVGTTAVGAIYSDAFGIADAATTAVYPAGDANVAAVTSVGLFASAQLFVEVENNGQASTAAGLTDLHLETLQ